jgi:GT2 family glycosyltransferase
MSETLPEGHKPDVSVIIVNFNGLRFLDNCLLSLKCAFKHYSFETIVVDNASTDGSQQFLRDRTDIRYIESKENLGFTGGNNLGVKAAQGSIILLLNNDTHIETCLDPLIDKLRDEEIGVAGCRLVYQDERIQFSVGLDHTPLRIVLSWIGFGKKYRFPSVFRLVQSDPEFYNVPHSDVDWVSGACLATRRDIWDALSGLDETFFMYCEDVDYCLRVRNFGKRVVYVPDSCVTHFEGGGKAWIGGTALNRASRSYQVFARKHYGVLSAKLLAIALGCVFMMRSCAFKGYSMINRHQETKLVLSDKSSCYATTSLLFFKQFIFGIK